ncbi:MAG TPA: 2'-5' RNA ligase family protein, partial [Solirubrobacter sp.]|nr:2'-5' RNA ligase family protein [Solirubrobacter sp.]
MSDAPAAREPSRSAAAARDASPRTRDPSSPAATARDPSPPAATARDPSPAAPRKLRLFVALELPDPVRAVLARLGAAADPGVWRPLAPEALHLTLAFLGSRPPADVARIAP